MARKAKGYSTCKMKGHTLPGIKQRKDSTFKLEEEGVTKVQEPKKVDEKVQEKQEVDPMFGLMSDDGDRIINEQGNWVSITKTAGGRGVYNRAKAAGAISTE